MKFKLKQEKLEELLEKLIVKNIFPSSVMVSKGKELISIQKEVHGRALRVVKFKEKFFESIEESNEAIEIDADRTINVVKNIPANTNLVVETKGNKLAISRLVCDKDGKEIGVKGVINISYKDPGEVQTEAPYEVENGVPLVGSEKVPLPICFEVDLSDMKSMTNFAGSLNTKFYSFKIKDKNLSVRVGDLHDFSDYDIENPVNKILKGENVEVIFTFGTEEIVDTFRKANIKIHTANSSPGLFSESDDTYTLAVLIPPYIEGEE